MDDTTRNHYDHACGHVSSRRDRAKGPAMPLKTFHNAVKRSMIRRFTRGAEALLDVGCGRGGDLGKWVDEGISYVKGLDISSVELEEARRRYSNINAKSTTCEFVRCDTFGTAAYSDDPSRIYDAVSCMFAMHYFFRTEDIACQFFRNVASALKPGGVFFGCVPSGRRVIAKYPYTSDTLRLVAMHSGAPKAFGSAYVCAIGDTVVRAVGDTSDGSLEYLVYSSVLTKLARSHGLEPLELDIDMPGAFEEPRGHFRHFKPEFPTGTDPSLSVASSLFAAFAFRKTCA